MWWRRLTVAVLCLISVRAMAQSPVVGSDQIDASKHCAQYAVGVALDALQLGSLRFRELKELVPCDDRGYSNLLDVARGLRSKGADVTVSESRDPPHTMALAAIGGPGVGVNHFIVLRPLGGADYAIYSPPHWVEKGRWEQLRDSVVGPILLMDGGPGFSWGWFLGGFLLTILIGIGWRRASRGSPQAAVAALMLVGLLPCSCRDGQAMSAIEVLGGPKLEFLAARDSDQFEVAIRNNRVTDAVVKKSTRPADAR